MFSAAASQVGICNRALARCGVKQFIVDINDPSQEAITCALFWDNVRQKLLGGFPWKFATRTAALQEFSAQCSTVELIGTGTADIFVPTVVPGVPGSVDDLAGTYNVVVRVSSATAIQVSIDGGITWGSSTTFINPIGGLPYPYMTIDGTLLLGHLSVGSGLTLTGHILITFASSFSASDVTIGDVYRFTATDGVEPEYTYAYALPADLLVGRYLWPGARSIRSDQRIPWKRGSCGSLDVLWSDASPDQNPTIIYVEDVTDASRFTPGFSDVMAWRLAYEISGPLKVKTAPQDINAGFVLALNESRSIDFIEFQEDPQPDSATVAARGYNWLPYNVGGAPPIGGWFPW
jgi:hypothetical protein